MTRACSTHGEKRNAYRILVIRLKEKSPLGIPRRRWVGNAKINFIRQMGWDGMDSIDLAQDRDQRRALVNTVMNDSTKCWEVLEWLHNWQLLRKGSAQ
jgi:hypothetical protein